MSNAADSNSSRSDGGGWLKNSEARSRAIQLLDESGVPLEARVAKLCQRTAKLFDGHDDLIMKSGPLVYGSLGGGGAMREIDQLVTMYQEFELDEFLGVQLALNVPIEAKHRRGAQVFGVAVDGLEVRPGAIPIAGGLVRTSLVRNRVAILAPNFMRDETLRQIAVLLFKDDGRTPAKISEENLVYKSASALYDFIATVTAEHVDPRATQRVTDGGYVDEFDNYLQSTRYPPRYVARRWIRDLDAERVVQYARNRTSGRRLYHMIDLYCPLVCIDSPAFAADLDGSGRVVEFEPRETLLTAVRAAARPAMPDAALSMHGPEAITTVVTLDGLEAALTDLIDLFGRIRTSLQAADSDDLAWAFLEEDFLAAVTELYLEDDLYRSDLHIPGP